MKYILLDTNIIIDMVIYRKKGFCIGLLESFIKLLENDEIVLIIPEIVKIETLRNIEDELLLVGTKITDAIEKIKLIYGGVVTYKIEGLNITENKKRALEEMNEAYNKYNKNKEKYKKDILETIDLVFNHENSIIISCDEFLSNAVMKRRIYKRAPMHIEKKESYGDALIAEILINLERYVELSPEDEILFVTGNYKDFCIKNNPSLIATDILEDIKTAGIPCEVKCIGSFEILINKALEENVKNANLTEEFKQQLHEKHEAEKEEVKKYFYDMERESVGLSTMDSYHERLEEDLINSTFMKEIIEQFEIINSIYAKFEDYCIVYDKLIDRLKYSLILEINNLLIKFKKLSKNNEEIPDDMETDISVEYFLSIYEWLINQQKMMESILEIESLPDSIQFGDEICIVNSKLESITFAIEKLVLYPEEMCSDYLEIKLYDKDRNKLASGKISVTYGYIRYDIDGHVMDGLDDDISYDYTDVINELKKIVECWEKFNDEQEKIINQLQNEFEIY